LRKRLRQDDREAVAMAGPTPEFVLFGDSLTEWGFDEYNEGFGWFLEQKYQRKVSIVNEGIQCPCLAQTGLSIFGMNQY
jgi:hypothetical protein